jgi:hypothetical protein
MGAEVNHLIALLLQRFFDPVFYLEAGVVGSQGNARAFFNHVSPHTLMAFYSSSPTFGNRAGERTRADCSPQRLACACLRLARRGG